MALDHDWPVYRDTYRLVPGIFEVTKDFGKEYKYTLGQDMKRDALRWVRDIDRAIKPARERSCRYRNKPASTPLVLASQVGGGRFRLARAESKPTEPGSGASPLRLRSANG